MAWFRSMFEMLFSTSVGYSLDLLDSEDWCINPRNMNTPRASLPAEGALVVATYSVVRDNVVGRRSYSLMTRRGDRWYSDAFRGRYFVPEFMYASCCAGSRCAGFVSSWESIPRYIDNA